MPMTRDACRAGLLVGLLSGAAADCGGSPCIVAAKCATLPSMPGYNATRWRLAHSQIDGLQATNILLLVPVDGDGAGSCKGSVQPLFAYWSVQRALLRPPVNPGSLLSLQHY